MDSNGNVIDLSNQIIGTWIIKSRAENVEGRACWLCECSACGYEDTLFGHLLNRGRARQCKQCKETNKDKNKQLQMRGKHYGRLTVISPAFLDKHYTWHWNCKCDCGNLCIRDERHLKRGVSLSCGCIRKELLIQRSFKHGTEHRLVAIRAGMIQRCDNPKHSAYKYYGGRGITVCVEWKENPESFYIWAKSNGYNKNLSIDRIDNDGDYTPDNCRWATRSEQANNTSVNHLVTLGKETKTLGEWCDLFKLRYGLVRDRIVKLSWSVERALTTPPRKMTFKEIQNEKNT